MFFPDFNIPEKKDQREKWAKQILDAASYRAQNLSVSMRKIKYRKNFLRYIGELDLWEGEYMYRTFGLSKPALYANYPLIEPLINRLVGQYSSTKTNFSVSKINENANSEKLDMMAKVLIEDLIKPIQQNHQNRTGVKIDFEQIGSTLPMDKKKWFQYNYRDREEESIYYSIDYIMNMHKVGDEYGLMLYDCLINDDFFGRIDYEGNTPVPRRINPEQMIFPEPPESYIWYDSTKWDYAGEDMRLTYDEVIKRFGPRMKPSDLLKLRENVKSYRINGIAWYNGIQCYWMDGKDVFIRVVPLQWKGMTDKPFKVDEKNYPFAEILSTSIPRSEVWQGFRIGHDIYSFGKKQNQITDKDNWREMQLDYFGMLTRHSFMRKAWPIQNLYNAANICREFLTNQAGGKAIVVKQSKLPDDMKMQDVPARAKIDGIIPEVDKEGEVNSGSMIRGQIDFGISESVTILNALCHSLEVTAERMVGVPESVLGQAPGSTPVQTLNINNSNASFIVQPIFDSISRIKEMSLQKVSDLVKYLWADDEEKSYFLGDGGLQIFKLRKTTRNSDYAIFVQDNMKDQRKKKDMLQLGEKVLATDATMILELIKMYNADAGIEAEKILENGITEIRRINQQMQQSKIDAENNKASAIREGNDLARQKMMLDSKVPVDVAKVNKERGLGEATINKAAKENVAQINRGGNLDVEHLKGYNNFQNSTLNVDNNSEEGAPE